MTTPGCILTATAAGAIAYTKNSLTVPVEKTDYIEQGLFTGDANEVLQLHREAIDCLQSAGYCPTARTTLEEFLATRGRLLRTPARPLPDHQPVYCGHDPVLPLLLPHRGLPRYRPNSPAPWLTLLGTSRLRVGAHPGSRCGRLTTTRPCPARARSSTAAPEPVEQAEEVTDTVASHSTVRRHASGGTLWPRPWLNMPTRAVPP